MGEEKKFLIIRLSAIGDVVHTLPMAKVLRDNFPNSCIDWVVSDACSQIIKNNPLIDNCYSIPLAVWKKNWLAPNVVKEIAQFNRMLQKNKYDVAFDAHGMFKSAVILAFCGARKRVGYSDYREGATLAANVLVKPRSKRPHTNYHVVRRHLDMVQDILQVTTDYPQAELPPSEREIVDFVSALIPKDKPQKPVIVFAPATTWDNKHWDVENWKALYNNLKDDTHIVFTGVSKDVELINKIICGCSKNTVLAGKTDLAQYIEVLRQADIVVSPDSSASHLAFACNSPVVLTIFCATSKNTFAPLGDKHIAFPKDKPICTPCHKRKCRFKHKNCTYQATYKEVLDEILKILKNLQKPSRKTK